MRRTILFGCVLALTLVLAPPASADEPIPVTCTMVSIQNGWGTGNDKEINEFWIGDDGWLYHHGTGYFLAHGDTYCRGRWYLDGGWRVADPAFPWGVEGYLEGDIRMELSHANVDGGFLVEYAGEFIWDVPGNRVWAGAASGEGYGELDGWQVSLTVYLPFYPPVGAQGPGAPQHTVWTGDVTPADG